jgi:hypothetical protein
MQYDFSNDTKSVRFDFFLISSIVYGIDNLLDRHEYSIDAWARDIEICFPVNNLQIWNAVKTQVEELLTFLTGDYWSVSFSQTNIRSFFKEKAKRWKSKIPTYDFANYSFASLFSGGLDSLVGVINGLDSLLANKKGLLISHYDGTSPGANKDQERLNDFLSVQPGYRNKYDWIQEGVSLSNSDTTNTNLVKESSYRSRSLLFIGIAVYCISNLPNCDTLTIPENGTISLNYPLTPSRSSTLSTRTTHPHYLKKLQQLLDSLGLAIQLQNPFGTYTKGRISGCLY